MDKETMRMKLTYWSGIIKEARASGMKISKWCEMNQITERQYYYWHKKVMHDTYTMALMSGMVPAIDVNQSQPELPAVPEFAELTVPDTDIKPKQKECPGINIRCGEFTINVDEAFSERELSRVLKVMSHVK